MKITKDIAYPIVQRLAMTMNYNLNIIDDNGMIIASTDSGRMDSIHEGARQVLQSKQALIIYSDDVTRLSGTREGVNLPIEFMDQIIGVVGITGNPDDLMQLAQMTKMTVELMLQHDYLQKQAFYKQQLMQSWIMELINPDLIDETKLEKHAKHFLNINLNNEVIVYVIELPDIHASNNIEDLMKKNDLKVKVLNKVNQLIPEIIFSGVTNANNIILGITLDSTQTESEIANKLFTLLKSKSIKQLSNFRIAAGSRKKGISGIRQSYFEATQCLELMKKFNMDTTSQIRDWGLIRLLDTVPRHIKNEFLLEHPIASLPLDLKETLEILIECDHNLTVTAEKLHIHRNTLTYRLENIHQLLNLNPKSGNDLVILKVLMILQKLNN